MDRQMVLDYVERWKAVEQVETEELRALSSQESWRQLNTLLRFMLSLGFSLQGLAERENKDVDSVRTRWKQLRENYHDVTIRS